MTASLLPWEVTELVLCERLVAPHFFTGGAREWERMELNGPRVIGGATAGVSPREDLEDPPALAGVAWEVVGRKELHGPPVLAGVAGGEMG